MINIFPILILLLVVIITTVVLWKKVELKHLNFLANAIIWFLPFEYLPSIPIMGARLKINYVVITIATYLAVILMIKRKLSFKFNNLTYLFLMFLISTVFSFENILVLNRFAISYLGLIFCMLAAIIVSNYATNINLQLKRLFYILCTCAMFGLYQFVGDIVGLKPKYTFLREMYTKVVFGIPRIQGTSNEPQLFAGILFFPLAVFVSNYFLKVNNNTFGLKSGVLKYSSMLIVLVFVLTISKGAFIAFIIGVLVLLVIKYFYNSSSINFVNLSKFGLLVLFLSSLIIVNPSLSKKIEPIIDNIVQTVGGTAATSTERSNFIDLASELLENNQYRGIGAGQFGVKTNPKNKQTYSLIVNNVYLEVWLEYGFLALMLFIIILILTFLKVYDLAYKKDVNLAFVLLVTLLSFLIQWLFFSPIYITPIFIMIGLCWNEG